MKVIPAMNISMSTCVRLERGDLAHKIEYPDQPLTYAKRWEAAGAEYLHIVDIDAAKDAGHNRRLMRSIACKLKLQIQFGGGIRNRAAVNHFWTKLNIRRLVLGTAVIQDRDFLRWTLQMLQEALVVDVAAKDGKVFISGWEKPTNLSVEQILLILGSEGVSRIMYTDISRDGMLEGPNFREIEKVVGYAQRLTNPISVAASGGIGSLAHLHQLKAMGVNEAIVGRALYENKIDLAEAIAASA